MPDYRLSFIFEYGKQGWSEQWYRTANTLEAALDISVAQLNNYLRVRAAGVTLRAIRANDVDVKRRSLLRITNLARPVDPAHLPAGGEPASTALLCYVTGANFTRRPLLLKGLSDVDVVMNGAGLPIFGANLLANLRDFKRAVNNFGGSIRALNPPAGLNVERNITTLAAAGASNELTNITFTGTAPVVGQRLIFHGLPRRLYPGFGGAVPVINVGAQELQVGVAWQGSPATRPGLGARFYVSTYSLNQVQDIEPEDFRSRKVGRPSLLSRGRRSALHFRSA